MNMVIYKEKTLNIDFNVSLLSAETDLEDKSVSFSKQCR